MKLAFPQEASTDAGNHSPHVTSSEKRLFSPTCYFPSLNFRYLTHQLFLPHKVQNTFFKNSSRSRNCSTFCKYERDSPSSLQRLLTHSQKSSEHGFPCSFYICFLSKSLELSFVPLVLGAWQPEPQRVI